MVSKQLGRPRDASIDTAVLDAASDLLEDVGYRGFAVEAVAKAAGVSKTAVYRRWPTRQHLVLAELSRRLGDVELPESACLACDLRDSIALFLRAFHCMGPDLYSPLLADCTDPELRDSFTSTLLEPPRITVKSRLKQARDRGELRAEVDVDLAVDFLAGLVHYRLAFGHAGLAQHEIDLAVETTLKGLAQEPSPLHNAKAHS